MKLTMNRWAVSLVMLALLVGGGWLLWAGWLWIARPLIPIESQATGQLLFAPGDSVRDLANALHQKGWIRSPKIFLVVVKLSGKERNLLAGEYQVMPGMTMYRLFSKMIKGERVRHAFTIVEGWTFAQVITALQTQPNLSPTLRGLDTATIMQRLGHEGEDAEGRFAPDTYLFSHGTSDLTILREAYQLMERRLKELWLKKAQQLPYHCPYEGLIVASLVEKETAVAEERPIIAGIILERLRRGMRLQIDPTVIYGLGQRFTGKLRRQDLKVRSAYNTYQRSGLPPTPICMPGRAALEAAFHPVITPYLYYVAQGDGGHAFSSTLSEHEQAIRKYLLKKRGK